MGGAPSDDGMVRVINDADTFLIKQRNIPVLFGPNIQYETRGGTWIDPKTGERKTSQHYRQLNDDWDNNYFNGVYQLNSTPKRYTPVRLIESADSPDYITEYDLSPDYWLPLDHPDQKKKIIIKSPVDKKEQGGILFSKDGSKLKN